jgi:predicted dehydrogenase
MALTRAELTDIVAFYDQLGEAPTPILLTGFNRRFSEYGTRLAALTADRTNPMILDYRMNAGYIPGHHWVHSEEGGGRNLGEACHIYDLFTFLTGSRTASVSATAMRPTTDYYASTDNFVATIAFEDGSVASLTYTALGSPSHPKERLDVYVDGSVLSLDDYRELLASGHARPEVASKTSEKGQRQELEALIRAIRAGGEWPIPLWQQVQATEIALRVQDLITGHA